MLYSRNAKLVEFERMTQIPCFSPFQDAKSSMKHKFKRS